MTLMEQVYESMTGHVIDRYRLPGVSDAFSEGSFCMECYNRMRDAYDRLCDRLGVIDEDEDVEQIIYHLTRMQEELCYQMYQYGAQFGNADNDAPTEKHQ